MSSVALPAESQLTSSPQSLKIVLVGDACVGKSSLTMRYIGDVWPDYHQKMVDDYALELSVDHRSLRIEVVDISGEESYHGLRPHFYKGAQVFVVCFSVDRRHSYSDILDRWQPELQHLYPNLPVVLVATKTDLRTSQDTIERLKRHNDSIISPKEGQALAKNIGAAKYIECSALQQQGLSEVFEEAARAHFEATEMKKKTKKKKSNSSGCRLM